MRRDIDDEGEVPASIAASMSPTLICTGGWK
jgi:hypothetical protein